VTKMVAKMAEPMNQLGQWASDQVLGSWSMNTPNRNNSQQDLLDSRPKDHARPGSCKTLWRRDRSVKRAVRRNKDRFPVDFMFELTKSELVELRCQIGSSKWGGTRYIPFAFTEQGVAMYTPTNAEPIYLGSRYKNQLTLSH
jgi:hypothetical protein